MFLGRTPFVSLLLCSLVAGLSYDNVDKAATPRVKELLRYVQAQYGSKYISGQQDPGSVQWLQQNVGVTPAILGTDLMYYSPSATGGINALVWHWYAPTCLLDSEEQPWYSGFYTEATCFNLKRLSDANVPILFRPLHEPEGGWFWWGAHGPAPFKQLWDLIYDRITRVHDIHKLVWVCNTADPSWYPGNNKCDIATVDHYAEAGDHGVLKGKFQALKNVTRSGRVLALAEVGSIPDPELQAKENDGKHNSLKFLQNISNSSRVVSLNGAPKLDL
ncbi:glycoside hydrolase superfamily [Aspergillus terricola var. indicus]